LKISISRERDTRIKRSTIASGLSPLGNEILLSLEGGPKSLSDLRASISAKDTSILHSIKRLESENLIRRDTIAHSYSLTNIGHVYAVMLNRLSKASNVLRELKDFWLQHDLSGIPEYLLLEIGALNDSTIVRSSTFDLDVIYTRFLESLKSSKRIDGLSPVFHTDFVGAVAEILGKGAKVRLVVTKEVLDRTKEEVKLRDLVKYVKRVFIDRNLEIYIREDLKVALMVTEDFLSLGLFTLDGHYDTGVDLMSSHPQALEWGERLFDYYRGISRKIKFTPIS